MLSGIAIGAQRTRFAMYLSHTLSRFLGTRSIEYDTIAHRHTINSNQTAFSAQVPRNRMAKGVLLGDDERYVLAVVPAAGRVDIPALAELLGSKEMVLAGEDEIAMMFPDCELGAIPIVGSAYGVEMVVDASLLVQPDVYFEGGDHEHLVHVNGPNFRKMMLGAKKGLISN
jgi:Ala-tRNA(Pro) deacylase